ncbi:MAG: hypothetical protein KDB10_09375 [Acidimicrobiales bacterium]|nr:hypothetical protein [Acidimicrobiales bacterium]
MTPRPPVAVASPGLRRRRLRGEKGYALVLAALLLLPLLAFTGFATDVGAWYARANRIQRAADAAALAGVVWMPDLAQARTVALATAQRNGFVNGQDDITITVSADPSSPRKLRVIIEDAEADQFFSELFIDHVAITRAATAEYVLPVPLGSPLNRFGNDPVAGVNPNFWGSISGPYTDYRNGDPFSTKCGPGSSGTGCSQSNAEYRDTGYTYAIEVPPSMVGQPLTVELYDAGHYHRNNYPTVETADNTQACGSSGCTSSQAATGVRTQYEMFAADDTPLDNEDNPSLAGQCNGSGANGLLTLDPEASAGTYKNQWSLLCRVTVTTPGVYPMRVRSSGIAGATDSGNGWNQYAVRACAGSTSCTSTSTTGQPRVYALSDMSIFNKTANSTADFYLAEVDQIHAGKTFEISLFDPGDGQSGNAYLTIKRPNGSVPPCTYRNRSTGSSTTLTTCTIQTSNNGTPLFNGQWLDISIGLPTNYACTVGTLPGCWWTINYQFGGQPNDRTTWSAQIIGDPVHLVRDG